MEMINKVLRTFRLLTIFLFLIFLINIVILVSTHYSTNSIYQSIASLVFFALVLIIYTYYMRVGTSNPPPNISKTKVRISYIISIVLAILALMALIFANWMALIFLLTVSACFALAPLVARYEVVTRTH